MQGARSCGRPSGSRESGPAASFRRADTGCRVARSLLSFVGPFRVRSIRKPRANAGSRNGPTKLKTLRARAHPLSARSRPLHLHPPHDRSSTPARLSSGRARPGVGTNGSCTVGGQVMLIASSTVGGQVMVENPTRTQGPVLVPATSRLVGAFEHLPARACVSGRPGLALWRRQIDFRRVWGGD